MARLILLSLVRACYLSRSARKGEKNENSGSAPEKANSTKRKRSKHDGKKGKTSTTCFNCGKKGYFVIALSQRGTP